MHEQILILIDRLNTHSGKWLPKRGRSSSKFIWSWQMIKRILEKYWITNLVIIRIQSNSSQIQVMLLLSQKESQNEARNKVQLKGVKYNELKKLLVNTSGYSYQNRIKFSESWRQSFQRNTEEEITNRTKEFRIYKKAIKEQMHKSILEHKATKKSNSWWWYDLLHKILKKFWNQWISEFMFYSTKYKLGEIVM